MLKDIAQGEGDLTRRLTPPDMTSSGRCQVVQCICREGAGIIRQIGDNAASLATRPAPSPKPPTAGRGADDTTRKSTTVASARRRWP